MTRQSITDDYSLHSEGKKSIINFMLINPKINISFHQKLWLNGLQKYRKYMPKKLHQGRDKRKHYQLGMLRISQIKRVSSNNGPSVLTVETFTLL